jgi:hypothetical protein
MANITARVQKRAAALLEPGERVTAALLVEPKGTYGITGAAIAALPRTMTRKLEESAMAARAAEGGMAGRFLAGPSIIAVTDRRTLAIPSNGISMKAVGAEYAPGDLKIELEAETLLGRRLRFLFRDGTSVVVDVQRGQDAAEFSGALG